MASEETLKEISNRLQKTQAGLYSMATQIQTILTTSTQKLTDDQVANIEAQMDLMDETFTTHNTELIAIRDSIKSPDVEG